MKMNTMRTMIKKVPIPICGLVLAIASLGNLVKPFSSMLHTVYGVVAWALFALFLLKLITHPKMVAEDLKNPIIASASGTCPMAMMVLSTYAISFVGARGAYYMWLFAIALHLTLIFYFSLRFMRRLDLKNVYASYFIVYVGLAVAAVTAPSHGAEALGRLSLVVAFPALFLIGALVFYRYHKLPEVADAAKPLFCITAAPTSLCLAGYLQSATAPSLAVVLCLLVAATLIYAFVLVRAIGYIQTLAFYPSYAGFTFPFVICPTAAYQALLYLEAGGTTLFALKALVFFEALVGVAFVTYALLRYLSFLGRDAETLAWREDNCTQTHLIGIFPYQLCSDEAE